MLHRSRRSAQEAHKLARKVRAGTQRCAQRRTHDNVLAFSYAAGYWNSIDIILAGVHRRSRVHVRRKHTRRLRCADSRGSRKATRSVRIRLGPLRLVGPRGDHIRVAGGARGGRSGRRRRSAKATRGRGGRRWCKWLCATEGRLLVWASRGRIDVTHRRLYASFGARRLVRALVEDVAHRR